MQSLAQMRSQTFGTDNNSIISNANVRKASRLSNFNPIGRSRTLPRYDEAQPGTVPQPGSTPAVSSSTSNQSITGSIHSVSSTAVGANSSSANSIAPTASTTPSSYATTTPINSLGVQHSNFSSGSVNSTENNYQLVKMDTNHSICSDLSMQSQFKVSLKMSKTEIELIRYTWNKMLLDEPIEQPRSFGMPGGFHNINGSNATAPITPAAGSKEKTMNYISRTSASTVASSLFCRQFYSNLLSMDNNLEKLFPSIKHQAVAFAGVMSFAISQLENLNNLDDYLINLGKRHSRILGIEPSNFELMGEALIQTFHERFGTRFTQELEVLWIKLYMYLANSLLQFGIDPIIRFEENGEESIEAASLSGMGQSFFWGRSRTKSYSNLNSSSELATSAQSMLIDDKRSSISTAATGTTNANTMSSVSTAATSVDMNLNKKLPPVVPTKDSNSITPPLNKKANIKKRKRDCVIM